MENQIQTINKAQQDFSQLQISSLGNTVQCIGLSNWVQENVKNCTSIIEAIQASDMCVSKYVEVNKPAMQLYIIKYLSKTMDFFGLDKERTSKATISEIVNTILDNYGFLHLEEIPLVFRSGYKSDNSFYGRLDGNIIMRWFKQYVNNRCNACEGYEIDKKEEADKKDKLTGAAARQAYLEDLARRVKEGDAEAIKAVEQIRKNETFYNSVAMQEYNYRRLHQYDDVAKKDAEIVNSKRH